MFIWIQVIINIVRYKFKNDQINNLVVISNYNGGLTS